MIEQPTFMGRKVGWSQKMVDDFKELLFKKNANKQLNNDNCILQSVGKKKSIIIDNLLDEVARLRDIDAAVRDYTFERNQQERDEFAREGFDEVVADRQLGRKFKA